jgi:hypothetical protein
LEVWRPSLQRVQAEPWSSAKESISMDVGIR